MLKESKAFSKDDGDKEQITGPQMHIKLCNQQAIQKTFILVTHLLCNKIKKYRQNLKKNRIHPIPHYWYVYRKEKVMKDFAQIIELNRKLFVMQTIRFHS